MAAPSQLSDVLFTAHPAELGCCWDDADAVASIPGSSLNARKYDGETMQDSMYAASQ